VFRKGNPDFGQNLHILLSANILSFLRAQLACGIFANLYRGIDAMFWMPDLSFLERKNQAKSTTDKNSPSKSLAVPFAIPYNRDNV
jgi:hypothetical protein